MFYIINEPGQKSSSFEYWRPPFIEDPNGDIAGDPQILVGDSHIFIGTPEIA